MTSRELAKVWGVSQGQAVQTLHVLAEMGRLIPTKVRRDYMDGRRGIVSAYLLKQK